MNYTIKSQARKYANQWVVRDESDKVRTSGSVFKCLDWVKAEQRSEVVAAAIAEATKNVRKV
jgi:hypothetical protein